MFFETVRKAKKQSTFSFSDMSPPIRGVPLNTVNTMKITNILLFLSRLYQLMNIFSIKPNSKLLRIKIVQAKDLNKDLFGSTDPFVQLVLCKKNNDTSVIEFLKTPTVKKVIFCLSITLVLPIELHSFFLLRT